jgi:hypothetical protein
MWRAALFVVLIAGCSDKERPPTGQGSDAAVIDSVFIVPDAAPPTVDAPPPPMPSCTNDAGECQLPPSACLDNFYMLYYTGGTCQDGTCQFMTNLMYCPWGCVNGGCSGGFT